MRVELRLAFFFAAALIICTGASGAAAAPPSLLPYTARTQGYAGWDTVIRGDIRTIGMAGATVGLANTFIASIDNPAGIAMTFGGLDVQLVNNQIQNSQVQDFDQAVSATNLGGTASNYPWGFSVGFWNPHSERQAWSLRDGTEVIPEVYVREFRASASRVFLDNKLSLGAGLILGRASHNLEFPGTPERDDSLTSYSFGGNIGAMVQFPQRFLFGATYSLPQLYTADPVNNPSPGISGFYRPVKTPWRVGLGPGWIPNRFLNVGLSLLFIGATTDTALVSDTTRLVGRNTVVQPRFGATYRAVEFKDLRTDVYAGSYYEVSRIDDADSRLHVTGGLEINLWIFNIGWGLDAAPGYRNYIYCFGLDVLKVARKLDLIPPEWHAPYGGLLPTPYWTSDAGLARPLVEQWNNYPSPDLIDIGLKFPGRLRKKAKEVFEAIEQAPKAFDGVPEALKAIPGAIKKVPGKIVDTDEQHTEKPKAVGKKKNRKTSQKTVTTP